MAITVEKMVSDVELLLNGGSISDDSPLEKSQIKWWLSYYLNMLVADECNNKLKRGEQIPSTYVRRAVCQVPEEETSTCADECDTRIFVEITDGIEILTLNNDGGCIMVTTDEGDEIHKASINTLYLFKHMRFAKPSMENLVYYRQGNKIFIEGMKSVDIPFNEVHTFYVPKQDLLELDDTDEVLCSDLILPTVIDLTAQKGRQMLYGTQEDTQNNGTDTKQIQYHTAIANPTKEAQ